MKFDRRLLELAFSQRGLLGLTIVFGLAAGVLIVLQARLLSRVVNLVFLERQDLQDVRVWLAWLLVLIVLPRPVELGERSSRQRDGDPH